MPTITVATGATFDSNDFWVTSAASTDERFANQTSQTGSIVLGIGNVSTTYEELVFQQGEFTFR